MANLPMNRTRLNAAIANQQPSIIAAAQANREAHIEAADTIDALYNFTTGYVAGGTLQPYPFGVNRQALINSGFAVNQRAVSGTVTLAAGVYGHDRWKAGAAGCTYTFSTVNNVTTITITAGSLVQVIEGNNLYSGTYTLTWSGTAQGKIGAGAYGANGITGAVTGGTNLSIEFNVGTISQVQFNFGSSAVPFQPRSFADELALCQRYYQRYDNESASVGFIAQGSAQTATAASVYLQLVGKMRTLPTLTYSSVSDLNLSDGNVGTTATSISAAAVVSTSKTITLSVATAGGLTAYRPYALQFNAAGSKFLAFDAEL